MNPSLARSLALVMSEAILYRESFKVHYRPDRYDGQVAALDPYRWPQMPIISARCRSHGDA